DDLTLEGVTPQFEKLFTFASNYSLRWDLTKSLGLTYTGTANAVIDEPNAFVDGDIDTKQEREFIWNQITNLGRMKNFNQSIAANYKIPLDKLPFTDWISSDIRYSVGYSWVAGPVNQPDVPDPNADDEEVIEELPNLNFGNIISNQRDRAINARIDMTKLYNKVTFLKNAGTPSRGEEKASLGTGALRFLMMLKSVNGSYKINESTTLPGFTPNAFLFGLDSGFNAPGIDFILGSQDPSIRTKAADKGWIVKNSNLGTPFEQTRGRDLDVQADVEPFKDVRIQLSWNRGLTNRYQEQFRYFEDNVNNISGFNSFSPNRSGSYSTSFLSIQSAFEGSGPNNSSAAFSQFENNITVIRNRLNELNLDTISYNSISQDVLIPAFIAAYSGQSANDVELSPFPRIPLPNWRIDYAGLSKIPAIAEIFSSFTISHGYNSTYSVSSFTSSLNFTSETVGLQNDILDYPLAEDDPDDGENRLVPVYVISQIMISEQFVPLIGINLRTVSNISTRMEFRKSRNLGLNMSNAQVTETTNNDVTVDFGYTKTGFKLPWRVRGRTIVLENDVTFRVAASVRDSETIQRKINDTDVITNGNRTFQLRPQMSYKINNQLDMTMYFERNTNNPKVGSFKRKTTSFGVQLRFGLAQ
ncbi:MAG: cell surface protein SprA, partial [Ekhidna sp.]